MTDDVDFDLSAFDGVAAPQRCNAAQARPQASIDGDATVTVRLSSRRWDHHRRVAVVIDYNRSADCPESVLAAATEALAVLRGRQP